MNRCAQALLFAWLAISIAEADDRTKLEELEARNLVFGDIVFEKHNIFDLDNPEENNWLYRWANRLHVVTRDGVIRKQLLFRPGDPFTARSVEESARILRRNGYFFDAAITVDSVEDNEADIRVTTRDVWTLLPDISLSRSGGETSSRLGIEDGNLLGRGQKVSIVRRDNVERESVSFEFADRHLGRSWVSAALKIADNSDGRLNLLSMVRPFVELNSRWSAGFSLRDEERRTARWLLGDEAAEYSQETRHLTAFVGWSAGLKDGWATRYTAGLTYDDNDFSVVDEPTLPALIPADRDLRYPFVSIEILEDRFEKSDNRNTIGRIEDFYLGSRFKLLLGYASKSLGSDRDALIFDTAIGRGFGSLAEDALLLNANSRGRIENGSPANWLTELSASYFHRQSDRRVFVTELVGRVGENLDLDTPVLLGGDSGLRGYPLRYQNGDASLLFRMEQRYFTDWYPFRLFRVGGAIFFDAGRVWGDNPAGPERREVLKDIGIGLRLAPTRLGTTKIVHLDVAFPLDGDASIDDVQFLLEAKRGF